MEALKWKKGAVCLLLLCLFSGRVAVQAKPVEVTGYKDGEYAVDVELEGGTGRAFVESPTLLTIEEGRAYAKLTWSSPNYDYMVIEGETYLNASEPEVNSTFTIPITRFDEPMTVIADTTAMGTPHEIEYRLTFFTDSVTAKSELPQEAAKRVVYIAVAIIVIGGILNWLVKNLFTKKS